MEKRTFIPPTARPNVKGEKLRKIYSFSTFTPSVNTMSIRRAIVCLHVRDDDSQQRAILKNVNSNQLLFLQYDDLGSNWNFSFADRRLLFYLGDEIIEPIGIYNRPYFPEYTHPDVQLFNNLSQALDLWPGSFIGAQSRNFHNSSKVFQLTSSIKNAIDTLSDSSIETPPSFFIKGDPSLLSALLKKEKDLIVKSCSGIRSEVATRDVFEEWNCDYLKNLPTLFQKCIRGKDIRIHVLDSRLWAVKVDEKSTIDYRYASKRSPYTRVKLEPHVKRFCKTLAKLEGVRLMGIDLIQEGCKYICLEGNPSPGWAGFHRYAKQESQLAETLVKKVSV